MKNKGFTLVEVIAVVVLLSLIALILTPQITKSIDESKKNSFRSSAEGLIESAEQAYTEMQYERKITDVIEFNLTSGKNMDKLETKGSGPTGGYIKIDPTGAVEIALKNKKYCAVKTYTDKIVSVFDLAGKECTADRTE